MHKAETLSTGFSCPLSISFYKCEMIMLIGKWFIVGVVMKNTEAGVYEINVDFREEQEPWSAQYSHTGSSPVDFKADDSYLIQIGNSFNGVIHSFQYQRGILPNDGVDKDSLIRMLLLSLFIYLFI